MRITADEISAVIEMDVANCIYDHCDPQTEDEYVKQAMQDLFSTKTGRFAGVIYDSNENRFDGREKTEMRVRAAVRKRIEELKADGYDMEAKQ